MSTALWCAQVEIIWIKVRAIRLFMPTIAGFVKF